MKIGLITFSQNYNHGAILQCLATYTWLKKNGFDVDVIKYIPEFDPNLFPKFWQGWGIKRKGFFKKIPMRIMMFRYGKKMVKMFDQFRSDNLTFSNPCYSDADFSKVAQNYDALICGSDQVWHFQREAPFFLATECEYKGCKISYAPCCGTIDQPVLRREKIGKWVRDIDFVSVRNDFSKKLIKEVSGVSAKVVADPTLLVDLSGVSKAPEGFSYTNYIVIYILGDEIRGGHQRVIKAIKNKVGDLPVVAIISSAHKPKKFVWADLSIYDAGPAEWVYLISNASFVYTDSFHGVLFSIKANRNFLAYYAEKWRSSRLVDIQERYSLDPFVIDNAEDAEGVLLNSVLNYDLIHEKVAAQVSDSTNFLKTALCDNL